MNFHLINCAVKISFVSISITMAFHSVADELPEIPSLPQAEYLTPDKMTREDRIMLSEYSGNYDGCLAETSIDQMNRQSDPRIVVDFAMKHCASIMEELNQKMIEKNFEPNFRQNYIHSVSKQSANGMLRMVMIGMANRSASPAAEPQPAPE